MNNVIHGESFDAYLKRKGFQISSIPQSQYEETIDGLVDELHETKKEIQRLRIELAKVKGFKPVRQRGESGRD